MTYSKRVYNYMQYLRNKGMPFVRSLVQNTVLLAQLLFHKV
jgi:hypothetical protein